jgi:hypothetical protein
MSLEQWSAIAQILAASVGIPLAPLRRHSAVSGNQRRPRVIVAGALGDLSRAERKHLENASAITGATTVTVH